MGSETLSKVLIMPELNHQYTNNASFHTLKDDSRTVFMSLPARMAAHILISTPFMPHKHEAIQKQAQNAHIPPTGDYTGHAYLIFVRAFSLSLVNQSRESIRISRGFEKKKKTQLETSLDVLVRSEKTIHTQNTSQYHLLFTSNPLVSSSDRLYETACRYVLGNTSANLIAMSFHLVNHRGAGDPSPISRKKNETLKNG